MLNSKSFLSVDFGAGSLKLAEFEVDEAGGLRLKQYAIKSLGAEGAQETTREAVMLKALQELITEKGIRAKNVNVCAPGFHVFSKFVKLPPVDASKVTQIIQYEAQQNVPFPLAEVVWDYQILGSTPTGEMEVLLVAIKADIVEGLFRVTESAGLRLQLADVSPAALCNAFRYNYSDLEDCTMLLDIGAKTSNLLFFEKGKVYSRSINLGANSITQDFANESKLPFVEAEKKKISEGFVSLGGAYEEPENPHQAAISKIARQFMTRLHIQVNQTMQFYRGQQGGSAPQRLFLSGGASLMPYTAQFFAEKLNVPVEYFNPFRNVQIDPSVNLEELARVAHFLGEVVGLGLRNLAHCPVELNLMPDSTLNWVQFDQKKPYFIATVFSLVLVVFASGLLFNKLVAVNQDESDKLTQELQPLQDRQVKFEKAQGDLKKAREEAEQFAGWIDDRFYWADVLTELHRILIQVETETGDKLHTPTGVWIEKFVSAPGQVEQVVAGAGPNAPQDGMENRMMDPRMMRRYRGRTDLGFPPADAPPVEAAAPVATPAGKVAKGSAVNTNEISNVTALFRGVNLSANSPSANSDIAYTVARALQESPLFDKDQTQLAGTIDTGDATSGTFTFGVNIKLNGRSSYSMVWIKRNLYFLIGSLVALALMAGGGYYLWTQMAQENQISEDISKKYSDLDAFNKKNPHPGTPDKIDNVKAAKEQEAALRAYVEKCRAYFQRVTPIPDSPKVANDEFARELRNTVTQLRHAAEQQSITLPNSDYYFTFEAQKKLMIFEPASLNKLAAHLGEIKVICDILFDAKINQLDNIRRELVSSNDNNPNDYLLQPKLTTVSTPLADLTPYQVTFRSFSTELAAILGKLAASPNALIVKTVNIEPAAATGETMSTAPVAVQPMQIPPGYNRYPGAGAYPGYGGGRRGGVPPIYQMPLVGAAAPVKTGPTIFLDEKPLRVTLLIHVVRLKPAK